jgi:hypothetical protein
VGAEKEEEYAGLAARRIEAAVRGQVLQEIPDLSARAPGRTAFTW